MPLDSGAPTVGDLVTLMAPKRYMGRWPDTGVWLVVETRSVHLLVIKDGEEEWVRRASVVVVG